MEFADLLKGRNLSVCLIEMVYRWHQVRWGHHGAWNALQTLQQLGGWGTHLPYHRHCHLHPIWDENYAIDVAYSANDTDLGRIRYNAEHGRGRDPDAEAECIGGRGAR